MKPTKKQRGPVIRLGTKGAEAVNDNGDRKAAIVTAKNPRRSRFGDVPDMTREEHKQRGDAADALRQIATPAPPKRKAHKQAKRRARFRELLRRVREE